MCSAWNICRDPPAVSRLPEHGEGRTHRDDVCVAHDGVRKLKGDYDLYFERRHVAVDRDVFDVEQAEVAFDGFARIGGAD